MIDGLEQSQREVADDPPPFLGRWSRVYTAVLCLLAVVITCFYIFARVFAP